jgi:hypothetical protein
MVKRNTGLVAHAPGQMSTPSANRAAAVERAAMLLANCMQASDTPIAELGSALGRMAQRLGEIGTPLFGAGQFPDVASPVGAAQFPAAAYPDSLRVFREAFARDIAVCIESLQFHDRLMQQLVQARDLLAGASTDEALTGLQSPAGESGPQGSIELF